MMVLFFNSDLSQFRVNDDGDIAQLDNSLPFYEERGSEASMADSFGIKVAAQPKESSTGQNFKMPIMCLGHSASIRMLPWQ